MSKCKYVYSYTWRIENYSFYDEWPIYSPKFTAENFDKSEWQIKLYPRGCDEDSLGSVCLSLKRVIPEKDAEVLKVKVKLELCTEDDKTLVTVEERKRFLEGEECLFSQVIKNEELKMKMKYLPDDTLIVRCRMATKKEATPGVPTEKYCVARTRTFYDEYSFTHIFRRSQPEEHFNKKFFTSSNGTEFRITLKTLDNDVLFRMKRLKGIKRCDLQKVKCIVSLFDGELKERFTKWDTFLFHRNSHNWHYPNFVKNSSFDREFLETPFFKSFLIKFHFSVSRDLTLQECVGEAIQKDSNLREELSNNSAFIKLQDSFRSLSCEEKLITGVKPIA